MKYLQDIIYHERAILEGTEGLGEQYEVNEEMKINSILSNSQKIQIKATHIIFISKLAQVLILLMPWLNCLTHSL